MGRSIEPSDPDEGSLEAAAEQQVVDRMADLSLEDVVRASHASLLRRLTAKVELGTATHQQMAILRNLLRDNGMTMGMTGIKTIDGEALPGPIQPLPRLEAPDYDD